ncbi:hypothetical protein MRX96_057691 [Rhipicephalus microplus]
MRSRARSRRRNASAAILQTSQLYLLKDPGELRPATDGQSGPIRVRRRRDAVDCARLNSSVRTTEAPREPTLGPRGQCLQVLTALQVQEVHRKQIRWT